MNEFSEDSTVFVRRSSNIFPARLIVGVLLVALGLLIPTVAFFVSGVGENPFGFMTLGFFLWMGLGLIPTVAGALVLQMGWLARVLVVCCTIAAISVLYFVVMIACVIWLRPPM